MLYPAPKPLSDPGAPSWVEWLSETVRLQAFGHDPEHPCPGCRQAVLKSAHFYPWCSHACRERATNIRLHLCGRLADEPYLNPNADLRRNNVTQ